MLASSMRMQIMWSRLLAIVEEQAQTLVRTAFSTSAREAGDLSAGLFDTRGRMIAQAVTGTPGHINSMALAVPHFIEAFPLTSMRHGDCYVTNDPWKATGHLSDYTVVTPVFHRGNLVALFACTTHVVDVGGIGPSPDGRQIYHEGLWVPPLPLVSEGKVNAVLMAIVKQNTREPVQLEGDLYALAACNEAGSRRLLDMMEEYGLVDVDELASFIIDTTRSAMVRAIREFPQASAEYRMTIDGYEAPIDLKARLTISRDDITVDYAGTSGKSAFGINCPKCYTDAYTAFGVKCIVAPTIPNNAGSLDAIKVVAPEGSIVNAMPPCAVQARSIIGHMLPDVVFGCLHQIAPGKVPAEGASSLWSLKLGGGHGVADQPSSVGVTATSFAVITFHSGGTGARPECDGLSTTAFPSGVRNVPVEITEAITPLVFWKKEFRQDSGGAGRFRGGLGQTMVIGSRERTGFAIFATFDRTQFPARGRNSGLPGTLGGLALGDGTRLKAKGRQAIPEGEVLVIHTPGGGGFGHPRDREVDSVVDDLKKGLVTFEAARVLYGVSATEDYRVNWEDTHRLRQAPRREM